MCLKFYMFSSLDLIILSFCLISLQDGVAADFTLLTKTLYDLHKVQEPSSYKGSPLDELVVENFDEEQIWQELELQNSAVLKHFQKEIETALSDNTLTLLVEEEESAEENGEDEEMESDCGVDAADDERPSRDSRVKAPEVEDEAEDYTDEDSDLDFDVDTLEKQEKQKKHALQLKHKTKMVPSEVDDKFFKLSEMECFLDDMDKREGKEDENEEDIDYFQDLPSDMDDDLDLDQILASNKTKKDPVCSLLKFLTSEYL